MTDTALTEVVKTGPEAIEIRLTCPAQLRGVLTCKHDVGTQPECKGPNDLRDLHIYLGRTWKGRLGELVNKLQNSKGVTLTYRNITNQRKEGEKGKHYPDIKVGYLSIYFMPNDDSDSDTRRVGKSKTGSPAAQSEDGPKKDRQWENEKKQVLEEPEKLDEIAKILWRIEKAGKLKKVILRGHTDRRGNERDNMRLSERRVAWAKNALQNKYNLLKNIPLQTVACGEAHARSSSTGDDIEQRAVTIELITDSSSSGGLPDSPLNLKAEVTEKVKVKLTWDSVADANQYNIYYSENSQIQFLYKKNKKNLKKIEGIEGSEFTHENKDILQSPVYYYIVTAVNGSGESEPSVKACAGCTNEVTISKVTYFVGKRTHERLYKATKPTVWLKVDTFTGKIQQVVYQDSQLVEFEREVHHKMEVIYKPKLDYKNQLTLQQNPPISDDEHRRLVHKWEAQRQKEGYSLKDRHLEPKKPNRYKVASSYKDVEEIHDEANAILALFLDIIKEFDPEWMESEERKEKLERLSGFYNLWIPLLGDRHKYRVPVGVAEERERAYMENKLAGGYKQDKKSIPPLEEPKYFSSADTIEEIPENPGFTIEYLMDSQGRLAKKLRELSEAPQKLIVEPIKIKFKTAEPH